MTPDEIRADFQKIADRFAGRVPDEIGSIRRSTVEKASAYIEHASQHIAACTCQSEKPFQIDVRRTQRPLDAKFQLRWLERMRAEDQAVAS